MSNDLLIPKIELLQEQIDNLEKSGFFTDAEIEKYAKYFRSQIAILQCHKAINDFCYSVQKALVALQSFPKKPLYGMTPEDYAEGMKYHNECFDQIKGVDVNNIEVNEPEIVKA